jgi:hypothetical protein
MREELCTKHIDVTLTKQTNTIGQWRAALKHEIIHFLEYIVSIGFKIKLLHQDTLEIFG